MDISATYEPTEIERKWYAYWLAHKHFKSQPDHREPFTVVIPPPNVTGVLHMGHVLNNTIQDILVRRARLQGKNACWVPGTDHASIATEAKVVNKLRNEGVDKFDLSRDKFLEHAWEWTHKHGGIILEQLKKLGASCDWDRTKFTMDDDLSESVLKVFVDLHDKGLIYRGIRMVNWDSRAKTAVSDEEVIYKEVSSKLYHVRYQIEGTNEWLTIATTRPETILGDTAVCVNPNDERYTHLVGKRVIVPLINRSVPIIQDEYVDMEFGTGCLKITPAHDINDYEIGIRHNLESIDILNDDGTLSEAAGMFVGVDKEEARHKAAEELKKLGQLAKVEDYVNKVGFSERTDAVIEPKLSLQWFLKMEQLAKPALENVQNGNIQFYPASIKNMYNHWMENVRDWNISRQLWWGHRIPAWYLPNSNDFVVALTEAEAVKKAQQKTGNSKLTATDLRQDEDVLDTWFSSWLWPLSVFDGIRNPENPDMNYYYPTNDLVTAPEIIFFWVARMIIAGYEYKGELPFRNVYFTGIVRDDLGRKMSKSLGNSPEPISLIEKYGADGVRYGMLSCAAAGNDLFYKEELPVQGRNFTNKIWNAFRLLHTWTVDDSIEQPLYAKNAINWFGHKLHQQLAEMNLQFDQYRLSDALMVAYKLFWDDFAAWYLEMIKPEYGKPIDRATYKATFDYFEQLMILLHPFMPFITEEIWHQIAPRKEGETIMYTKWIDAKPVDVNLLSEFDAAKDLITNIRRVRAEKQISPRQEVILAVRATEYNSSFDANIQKNANVSEIQQVAEKLQGAVSFMIGTNEYFVPLGDLVNKEEEIEKLSKELEYQQGFLTSVSKKLSNERFVQGAPEQVVASERKKQADAETKITALKDQIAALK